MHIRVRGGARWVLAAATSLLGLVALLLHLLSGAASPTGEPGAGSRALATTKALASKSRGPGGWAVVERVHGEPAVWVAHRSGVTLMRLNQALVRLDLHAGTTDGGLSGWTYGDRVRPGESHRLLAAFNGGFRLTYKDVGFVANNHVAVPLKRGLASIVTYADGMTNIGAWREGVPSRRSPVFSVLQNQHLLVDHGRAAANVSRCVLACWGGTIKLVGTVPRSGLGIAANGELLWAAGSALTPAKLARALIEAGAQRAIELDINEDWVAGYLYRHERHDPVAVSLLARQHGVAGEFLAPYTRDFIAVVARR
jgi:hypothetical protein